MSDDSDLLRAPAADAEFDGCLLDAFCEDQGFAFAKLDEIEWRSIRRGAAALIAAFCGPPDAPPLIAPAAE